MKQIFTKGWRPLGAILLFIIIWQVATRVFTIEEWLLPSPTDIIKEANQTWGEFLFHFMATVKLTIVGFIIGISVGLAVAILLHMLPKVRETFYPFLILSQNIPIIVLAPLLVIWFGFGSLPKLIIITLSCFFPIAVSALGGFQQTSRELVHYMKMMGATKGQLFWKLEFPHALPSVFSGLKIAATYSVMAAVISEWLGAQEGIGVFMTLATSSFRTSRVFVAIIVVMVLSLTFFGLIVLLEKLVLKWNKKGGNA
ncbi:ABC transporter permease [Virgibacillus sp. SK37]|uniref:ABC transporter permease n=1 Tax=Virgibacillus sp. SK37 TaxID=403957 RepID=UPI0004D0C4D0|nr:ABC transporter permease [Virgibacillus sp. SK37]AIF44623.1 nitrate ABC transporter permease [Virgibacillus sp. SK37]